MTETIICWHCKKELEELPKKIPFKATCNHCSSWLHCCKNCHFYQPGMPNNCRVPDTDYIADREAANYCEEFQSAEPKNEQKKDVKDAAKKLFRDDDVPKKTSFDALFGEED